MNLQLDLRGIPCPMNFVKAKLFLDKMTAGGCVELLLDDGEPFDNLVTSMQEEGQIIRSSEQIAPGQHKILLEKT